MTQREAPNPGASILLEEIIMDARLKEIVDNFEKMKIGVDEPFKFHCTMCGKCCINREDILLTPKDLFNMSKELGTTPREFVEQYCEAYIGGDSRMPIVRLKPRGSIKRCPLLKDRKCSVHKAKPTVCAMFPIGRCLISQAGEPLSEKITADQIQYIFTNPGCGDDAETHTVREWLDAFGISIEDDYFMKWQQTLLELSNIFRDAEKVTSERVMELSWTATYAGLYLNYDMEQDFLPQFEENAQELLALIRMMPTEESGEEYV